MKEQNKVYLVRAGSDGQDEEYVLDNNIAVIGYKDIPSLDGAKNYEDILKIITTAKPDLKPRAAGNFAGQLWSFAVAMKENDIIVLPRKLTSQVALGRVTGPYKYLKLGNEFRHTRKVKWIRPDIARSVFNQDLLSSFGAFMTVCNISRNGAADRIATVLEGKSDPGPVNEIVHTNKAVAVMSSEEVAVRNLAQEAHDQIVAQIQSQFKEHSLTKLVAAVLHAEGWVTKTSPPGPDGGVDIFAGRGLLGLDQPRLCVQVKSQTSPADVTVYRTLQGSMQSFKAEQGLVVCWGGFNKAVLSEAKQGYFTVRLWDSSDLVEAIYRNYENLPAEIQADLPLKKVWMLVSEETEE
ncbi:MAG TPA: restriction endonuclease [Smithellaceae bacterium]|nr:restriction endonuclease [Smithellaceae bacterium]